MRERERERRAERESEKTWENKEQQSMEKQRAWAGSLKQKLADKGGSLLRAGAQALGMWEWTRRGEERREERRGEKSLLF